MPYHRIGFRSSTQPTGLESLTQKIDAEKTRKLKLCELKLKPKIKLKLELIIFISFITWFILNGFSLKRINTTLPAHISVTFF